MASPRKKVAVAGGGIIGLSIAWRLAQADHCISVFDQGIVGGEASWAGAGMLAPGGEVDELTPTATLAVESRAMYSRFVRELEDASELPIDYQECGALDVAYSEDELGALECRAVRQRDIGLHSKRIPRAQVLTFWPRIRREGLLGGCFYPNDAIVNPRELTHALTYVCRKSGVSISEHTQIKIIEVSGAGVSLDSDKGVERFDIAIVAAGAWSSQIVTSGVPALPKAEPVKGHLIGYDQPEQTCNTIIRHGHTYLLQRANGLLLAGSSMERVGFDREVDPYIESDLVRRAGFVLPHLSETSPSEAWIGFRPASDDLHIGMWHSPRLHLAYGHFRNGILLTPITAARVLTQVNASLQTL